MVEGRKSVEELLNSDFEVLMLIATSPYLQSTSNSVRTVEHCLEINERDLKTIGLFQTNEEVIAVARMRPPVAFKTPVKGFTLILDDIRDPGNLGTIIRTADWYGVTSIVASMETADFYNSKVITSSMGSFTRVQMHYIDLATFLSTESLPVYGTFLHGEDVHKTAFGDAGLIVIGNESKGISADVAKFISHRITIPRYGKAESLNAGVATAIVLDNVRKP